MSHSKNYIYSFPTGLDGKESTCNAGALGLILGLGRSPGEGNGSPPVLLPGEFHKSHPALKGESNASIIKYCRMSSIFTQSRVSHYFGPLSQSLYPSCKYAKFEAWQVGPFES